MIIMTERKLRHRGVIYSTSPCSLALFTFVFLLCVSNLSTQEHAFVSPTKHPGVTNLVHAEDCGKIKKEVVGVCLQNRAVEI